MRKLFYFALLGAIGLPNLAPLAAHPHVWAKAKIEYEFTGERCDGAWVEWEFDQMFSINMLQGAGLPGSGGKGRRVFSAQENEKMYNYGFKNLEHYGYFVLIRVGQKRFSPISVSNFSAWVDDAALNYRFFIPLAQNKLGNNFSLAIFDTTFYCDIEYRQPAVSIVQKLDGAAVPIWTRKENKDYPVYYNPFGAATDSTVYASWKPGLETAYPEEIEIRFE